MFNKSSAQSLVSAVFLWAGVCAGAMAQLTPAKADGPVATVVAASPSASASLAASATGLSYKNPASPLTVAELAAVQRKKLEQDFFKKAGFSTEIKAAAVPGVRPKAAAVPRATTVQRYTLLAVYGTAQAVKAEVQMDGRVWVVQPATALGWATVDAIAPGRVQLRLSHQGRTSVHTLVPGETLEVSR